MLITTMDDKIIIEDVIDGKPVRCIFIFDYYSEKKYKQDFEEFVDFQKNRKPRHDMVDFHLYNVQNFEYISYENFKKYTSELFSKSLFYLIKQNPSFIISNELNVQLLFKRIKGWSYSFETSPDELEDFENDENACFTCAGIWYINNIVAPFVYLKKYEYSLVIRFFLHELTHFVDIRQDNMHWDEASDYGKKYQGKIKKIVGRISAYSINYLYNSLFNLREEGLAEFVGRTNSSKINIDFKGLEEYNSNLEKLKCFKFKKDAEPFYYSNISHGNLGPGGEYAIGRNMCMTIAMALTKENKIPYNIIVDKKTYFGYSYINLNEWISKEKKITIVDLKKEMIDLAIEKIKPVYHYYFVSLYEKACDILEIKEENRFITKRRFYKLIFEAKKEYNKRERKKLEKKGFTYDELPISENPINIDSK